MAAGSIVNRSVETYIAIGAEDPFGAAHVYPKGGSVAITKPGGSLRHVQLLAEHRSIVTMRAEARAVRFCAKPKLTTPQRDEALVAKFSGETLTDIAKHFNVSQMTKFRSHA
jgi:hypothetical protein